MKPQTLVTAIALAACLPLLAIDANASALPDPGAAKAANKCQATIKKSGAKFATKTLKSLEKCYDALFKCIQTKPGDQKCIDKALVKCGKEVDTKVPKERDKLASSIVRKCESFADLGSADGLGFDSIANACSTDFGVDLVDVASVAECLRAQHECRAEEMFNVQMPRAGQIADALAVPVRAGTCLENLGGTGDVGDPKGLGKALDKCQKELKKAGAKFVGKKLKSLEKCVDALFKCIQTKPGDQKCVDKATGKCTKELETNIPKAEAKLASSIDKRCLAIFAQLGPGDAMNVDGLAPGCQEVGIPDVGTIENYRDCVVRRHECLVDEIFRHEAPRAEALLQDVGHTLETVVCGPTPTPTTTPTPTLTPTPTPTITPSPTPSFTPAPGEFAVIVNKHGTGTGTVTSVPAAIDCGSTCAASVPAGTDLRLEARTANGSDTYFQIWDGDSCEGPFRDCDITTNSTHVIDANFGALDHNLVFVSSVGYLPNLGGTALYDVACNQLATDAGINNLAGDAFIAWMSDTNSLALTRLGAARGFVRMDGKAFVDDGITTLETFHAVEFDELGTFVAGFKSPMTGTNPGATLSVNNCLDWTSVDVADRMVRGNALLGPGWSGGGSVFCSFPDQRIFCFMNTKTAALIPPVTAGKHIYLTDTPFLPGTEDPDTKCEADKPAGTGTVKALLATTTVPASTHLDGPTTYIRPDGHVVGTGTEIVAAADATNVTGARLRTGVWQTGNGTYLSTTAWSGEEDIGDVGTIATTCNDWVDAGGTGAVTFANAITFAWWSGNAQPCSATAFHLFCVEQ